MSLSEEQEAFLEECLSEFSDRYTDNDLEYKEVFDKGIPNPPIVFPWYTKTRFNRDRPRNYNSAKYYNRDNKSYFGKRKHDSD